MSIRTNNHMDKVVYKLIILCAAVIIVLFSVYIFQYRFDKLYTVDTEWRNCDPTPPNFSGVCCRWLEDEGDWECRRVTGDQGFSKEDNALVPWMDGINPETQEMEGDLYHAN